MAAMTVTERAISLALVALFALARGAWEIAEWAYREIRAYALDDSSHLN